MEQCTVPNTVPSCSVVLSCMGPQCVWTVQCTVEHTAVWGPCSEMWMDCAWCMCTQRCGPCDDAVVLCMGFNSTLYFYLYGIAWKLCTVLYRHFVRHSITLGTALYMAWWCVRPYVLSGEGSPSVLESTTNILQLRVSPRNPFLCGFQNDTIPRKSTELYITCMNEIWLPLSCAYTHLVIIVVQLICLLYSKPDTGLSAILLCANPIFNWLIWLQISVDLTCLTGCKLLQL